MLTRRSKTTTVPGLTLRQLGPVVILDFITGWRPGHRARDRWSNFAGFLAGYRAVRTEFLARPRHTDGEAFAEALYQRALKYPSRDPELLGARLYFDWFGDVGE